VIAGVPEITFLGFGESVGQMREVWFIDHFHF
jgi:hypothetical protein